ncbi:uracil-DNA glycosylase [Marinomonas sp. MED121]|uniref:uracil-DNA glycosylase n=1 Tax=Marinomonas sp. MED121 TaxID=314277 RepID=UPI0000690FC8|nr:uracil-DNA glycosylase [Marinomonas sp. MED121]EAQ67821.1 uracil-DNA glycosylase [Marinomonas sp. MED121]
MQLAAKWQAKLASELDAGYMQKLLSFIAQQRAKGIEVFPQEEECFSAFKLTDFDQVKVVILGQDPYHGPGQAHGLSFSVKPGVKIPPSLMNMYKELNQDLNIPIADHGNLQAWAQQGVLLLNSVMTVERSKPNSHQKKGWETFTDKVVELLSQEHEGLVFMLWGSYAQKKGKAIDRDKHLVLEAVHPSPLSVYRGFFGCQHFSLANHYLKQQGKTEIDWLIPTQTPQQGQTLSLF